MKLFLSKTKQNYVKILKYFPYKTKKIQTVKLFRQKNKYYYLVKRI